MPKEITGLKIKAVTKLEKYPIGTTQEEIDKGLVKPEEIIISEEDILNKNIVNNLFGGK